MRDITLADSTVDAEGIHEGRSDYATRTLSSIVVAGLLNSKQAMYSCNSVHMLTSHHAIIICINCKCCPPLNVTMHLCVTRCSVTLAPSTDRFTEDKTLLHCPLDRIRSHGTVVTYNGIVATSRLLPSVQ